MSLQQDLSYISVNGTEESVIRMLNAAISNVGTGDVINEGDDIETINAKIKEEDGQHGLRVALPDLLDETCMQDNALLEKKAAWEARYGSTAAGTDQSEKDGCDDDFYTDERMFDIVGVSKSEEGLEVELLLYECENCPYYHDWPGWDDVARLYGCRVLVDNELYTNETFVEFCGTTVYQPQGDAVEESRIEPKLDVYRYYDAFNKLIDLSPERYRLRRVQCMEAKVRDLSYWISREQLELVKESLKENDGHAVIPEGVKNILGEALLGCRELKSISIPASVESIDCLALRGSSLESIEIHPDNPFFSSEGNCILSKDKTILYFGLKNSVIPSSVTRIWDNAFCGCEGLKKIVISGNVERIGNNAFEQCPDLQSVEIQYGVKEVGSGAFRSCNSLEEVTIPASVSTIYCGTFSSCGNLKNVSILGDTEVQEGAFSGDPCKEPQLAKCSELIKGVSRGCNAEEPDEEVDDMTAENELIDGNGHAVIPEGTEVIESCAFENCRGLLGVDIPRTVKCIEFGAFLGCTGLASIVIPEGVEEIQECAFRGCSSLADVILPESLKDLSCDAFLECPCEEEIDKVWLDRDRRK